MAAQEFGLLQRQLVDKFGIVIKATTVGGRSRAPIVGVGQREARSQVAEKRSFQQEADTRSDQLLSRCRVDLGVSDRNRGILARFGNCVFGSGHMQNFLCCKSLICKARKSLFLLRFCLFGHLLLLFNYANIIHLIGLYVNTWDQQKRRGL